MLFVINNGKERERKMKRSLQTSKFERPHIYRSKKNWEDFGSKRERKTNENQSQRTFHRLLSNI